MTKATRLNIDEFPYIELDSRGNETYYENRYQAWQEIKYDKNNNPIHISNHKGQWFKRVFNDKNQPTYYSDYEGDIATVEYNEKWFPIKYNSGGTFEEFDYDPISDKIIYYKNHEDVWWKREFNDSGELIRYEDSDGEYWDANLGFPNPHSNTQDFDDDVKDRTEIFKDYTMKLLDSTRSLFNLY